jgi:hypothetical protein
MARAASSGILVACCLLAAGATLAAASGEGTSAGTMVTGRVSHTATLLGDGRVLVVGGSPAAAASSAEIYDPQTNAWSSVASPTASRVNHTATLLRTGAVLVVSTASAELYYPFVGWIPAGRPISPRTHHTATLLQDGRVLIIGGIDVSLSTYAVDRALASAELYDPGTNAWLPAVGMRTARRGHTATLLADGRVLVAGGTQTDWLNDRAEIYDPRADRWSDAGELPAAIYYHAATLLPNRRVLLTGGMSSPGDRIPGTSAVATAQIFDPTTRAWSRAASMASAHFGHTATVLRDGRVLVAGSPSSAFGRAEVYEAKTNTWSGVPQVSVERYGYTITQLRDGRVLLAGGRGQGVSAGADLYDPRALAVPTQVGNPGSSLPGWAWLLSALAGLGAAFSLVALRARRPNPDQWIAG